MADPNALDIDRMLRGEYGSRPATPPIADAAPYRAPQTFEEMAAELAAGGPQAVPISPREPVPAGARGPSGAQVTTARDVAPGLFREPREQSFEEMAQEQAAKMDPASAGFQESVSAQQANALAREFNIPVEEAMALLGARVQAPSKANPKRPIVEEAQREALGGVGPDGEFEQGYLERQRGAMAEQGDATVDRDRELSALLARQGLENEVTMAGIAAREQMQAERLHEQSQAVARSEKAVDDAVKAYRAQPDVDPNRLWTNASARDRFLFAMGGMLSRGIFGGLFGRFQDLQGAIRDDIDAQKANIDKRATEVGGALDVQNAATKTQAALLEEYGDGRAADLAQEQARLIAAKDEYQQKAMELGIPITEAHVQQTLAEFDQAIAQAKTQLDMMVASTPRRIGGGTRPAIRDPDVRRLLVERGKAGIEGQAEFAKLGVTEQGAYDREIGKATIEAEAKRGEADTKLMRGEGGVYREAQQFASRAGPFLDVVNQVEKLESTFAEDFPGVGPFAGTETLLNWRESGKFDAAVGQLREAIGRARSQGAITEEEEARFLDSIEKGTALGGETRMRDNLKAIKDAFQSRVDTDARALSPEGREYIMRNKMIPDPDPTNYGLAPQREVVRPK